MNAAIELDWDVDADDPDDSLHLLKEAEPDTEMFLRMHGFSACYMTSERRVFSRTLCTGTCYISVYRITGITASVGTYFEAEFIPDDSCQRAFRSDMKNVREAIAWSSALS